VNSDEAKRILVLYRPRGDGADDSEFAEAIEQTKRDPELRKWFERHCAFQAAAAAKFQQIEVPADLKQAILDGKIMRLPFWTRRPVWLAAAAAIVLFVGLSMIWFKPRPQNRSSDFASRMARMVLREYRMDIITNDLNQIRRYHATNGAPSDYVLTQRLQQLPVTGAGALRWQGNPVSMVCFDRGDKAMLFLFVIKRSATKDAPPAPQLAMVSSLATATWSEGDNVYMLTGTDDSDLLRKYLKP
jgi:hypothetical protein